MTNNIRQRIGRLGEEIAGQYLEGRGFEILGRNCRTPFGEWDIIARQAGELVMIEVRTARTISYLHPSQSLSLKKQQHLRRAARFWMLNHPQFAKWPVRFDFITVVMTGQRQDRPEINHLAGAFEG